MLDWVDSVSSLSNREYVEIVATFQVLYDSSYQCTQCLKRVSAPAREKKGCETATTEPFAEWRKLIKFKRCPANYYSQYWASVIDIFRQYEKGILPFSGGLLDQPSKMIEALNLVETLKIEWDNERITKEQKAQKRIAEKWRTKSKSQ